MGIKFNLIIATAIIHCDIDPEQRSCLVGRQDLDKREDKKSHSHPADLVPTHLTR